MMRLWRWVAVVGWVAGAAFAEIPEEWTINCSELVHQQVEGAGGYSVADLEDQIALFHDAMAEASEELESFRSGGRRFTEAEAAVLLERLKHSVPIALEDQLQMFYLKRLEALKALLAVEVRKRQALVVAHELRVPSDVLGKTLLGIRRAMLKAARTGEIVEFSAETLPQLLQNSEGLEIYQDRAGACCHRGCHTCRYSTLMRQGEREELYLVSPTRRAVPVDGLTAAEREKFTPPSSLRLYEIKRRLCNLLPYLEDDLSL